MTYPMPKHLAWLLRSATPDRKCPKCGSDLIPVERSERLDGRARTLWSCQGCDAQVEETTPARFV